MKKEIILNFGDIVSELEKKELKICFINGASICVQDLQGRLYNIELYFQHSYLDRLIIDGAKVKFNLIEDKEVINNIEKYGQKEIWGVTDVEAFMKKQGLIQQTIKYKKGRKKENNYMEELLNKYSRNKNEQRGIQI